MLHSQHAVAAGLIISEHFNEYEEAVILYREALQADDDYWPGCGRLLWESYESGAIAIK